MNEINKRLVASVTAPHTQPYSGWSPCIEWCEQRMPTGWWYIGEGVFEFADARDHLMFLLCWGHNG
jgi:hypothetical protein